jgi:Relaxase/Mobilisation nuclease domain
VYIKGASRRSVGFWARHLQDTKENLRADIFEKRGLAADDLRDMMLEMEQDAHLTRCKNFMYIASFNPCPHEHPTERQWEQMFEIFEKHRGIPAGQQRIVIEHEKEGRTHRHVVWNRIDLENMRAFPDGKDAKICDAAEKEIELELGLERTPGMLDREPGTPRPPKSWEMYRGMKSGFDARDVTAEVTAIFRESAHAADFVEGLRQHGYTLVQGSRAYCILDGAGHEHSVAKRLDGVTTKELRAFMQGVDLTGIPTVEQGKAQFQERKQAERLADLATVQHEIAWEEALSKAAIEKEKIERRFVEPAPEKARGLDGREKEAAQEVRPQPPVPELGKTQGEIRLARSLTDGPQGFANALEDRGFILTRVTPDDIRKEMERLLEEWEDRRRNPQTWMEHEGGFAALNPELQASARRSFDEWEKQKNKDKDNVKGKDEGKEKQKEKTYTVEDYVDFVQRKWLEGPKSQLERAAGELAVITPFGSIYTLTPRNTGLDRDELPHYLKGIDRDALLSVTDAQEVMQDVREHRREEWLSRLPLGKTAGEIRLAYSLTQTGQEFASAIEDRGSILACLTATDAERLNRWEQQRLKEEWKAPAPEKTRNAQIKERAPGEKYRAGELVVVNEYGQIFQLTQHNTGHDDNARAEHLKDIDRAALLGVSAAQAAMQRLREFHRQEWLHKRREEWLAQQPLGRTAGEIRLAYSLTQTGQEFANAIEDRGSILACMTATDAERLNRWERQRLKEEWKAPAPEKTRNDRMKEHAPEDKYRAGELVVVNQYGQVFQLTRHNTGHDDNARDEHLKDIDRAALLGVTAAQGVMKEFQQHRQEERENEWQQKREEWRQTAREQHWPILPAQPERKSPMDFEKAASEAARDDRTANLHGTAAHVWTAFRQSGNEEVYKAALEGNELYSVRTGNRKAFAAALDEKGIAFAAATKEEAERSNREAQFARAAGNYAPRYKEGEIVIVTERRPELRRDGQIIEPRRVHKLDQSLAEKYVKLLDNRSQLKGIDATLKVSDERAQKRAADWHEIRLERATDIWRGGRTRAGNVKDNLAKSPAAILKPVSMGLNVIGKPLKILENIFEGIFAPKLTPEQIRAGKMAARERQADASEEIDFSNYTARRAIERRQLDNDREAERQAHRQRDVDRER